MKVPIFQHCTPKVVQKLVVALRLELFMPMDYIVLRGDMGHEMYFIQCGICEVTNSVASEGGDMEQKVLKELFYGDFFGEISIMMDCKRTANVRAQSYCELCVLFREDFNTIVNHHAEDRKSIEDLILAKYANPNEFRTKIANTQVRDNAPKKLDGPSRTPESLTQQSTMNFFAEEFRKLQATQTKSMNRLEQKVDTFRRDAQTAQMKSERKAEERHLGSIGKLPANVLSIPSI